MVVEKTLDFVHIQLVYRWFNTYTHVESGLATTLHVQHPIPLQRHHGSADYIPRGGTDLHVAVPDAAPDGPVQRRHPLHPEVQLDAALFEEEDLLLVGGKRRGVH